MRVRSIIAMLFVAALFYTGIPGWLEGATPPGEGLEYEVISIEPGSWVVTAKETESGEIVKFRMPPTAFKGKTFDADLEKMQPGQRFSARASRNARLDQVIVEKALPASPARRLSVARLKAGGEETLGWEILHVDARGWIVTARNRQTRKIAKFRVDPNAFNGFRFQANIRGIQRGQGFAIQAPNNMPLNNVATLLEVQK